MRPLPVLESRLSSALPAPQFSNEPPANHRRAAANPVYRAYPWLLFASTAIATVFCLLYISKPLIQTTSVAPKNPVAPALIPASIDPPVEKPVAKLPEDSSSLMPGSDRLPGDPSTKKFPAKSPGSLAFEETNLSVQHILTAQVPAGDLCRIVLDVPVLYQSRHLRWSEADVARARELLNRFADYQEKSSALRSEGLTLLDDWNRLLSQTIPAGELRADSPTLPANQHATPAVLPAGLDTSESIQITPVK